MFTFLPFTTKWPWRTTCRLSRRVGANPSLYTTLSSLRSSRISRLSPVFPFIRSAFSK